jgi:hypothetical protein
MTAELGVRPDHPRRQTVLPPRHEAASRDRLVSDSAGFGPVHESLGDTGSVMPPSHRWERLNRTALGHLGPGSPYLTERDASGAWRARPRRVDIAAIKGKFQRSPAPGAMLQGPSRDPRWGGSWSWTGPGRPVDTTESVLVADGTDSGPKGCPGPLQGPDIYCLNKRVVKALSPPACRKARIRRSCRRARYPA